MAIFITFNPGSEQEKRLALALGKQALEQGVKVFFPDRSDGQLISKLTEKRIKDAEWFIMFSTQNLDKTVQEEIRFAINQGKELDHIFVVYSNHNGRNLPGELADQFTSFFVDDYSINNIENFKRDVLTKIEKKEESNSTLVTLLGIGAAALLINAFSKR